MTSLTSMVVIAKAPVSGAVKTRLTTMVTPADAAHIALMCLQDTLEALSAVVAEHHVLLLAGQPGAWVPPGWRVEPQVQGGLDHRLARGMAALPSGPAVLVGMDTPQVDPDQLQFDTTRYDACLGMATDGGYWAIGLVDPARAPEVIEGVPMSRADTGQVQLRRMHDAGLRVQQLPELQDIDTPPDAARVAEIVPESRFALAWGQIVG